jgi:hypothetical protein
VTTIVVVLIGIGVLFIASSLDCTPLKDTFTKIVNNQAVDWSGKSVNCPGATTTPAQNVAAAQTQAYGPSAVPSTGKQQCPAGYIYVQADGKCHQVGARR